MRGMFLETPAMFTHTRGVDSPGLVFLALGKAVTWSGWPSGQGLGLDVVSRCGFCSQRARLVVRIPGLLGM